MMRRLRDLIHLSLFSYTHLGLAHPQALFQPHGVGNLTFTFDPRVECVPVPVAPTPRQCEEAFANTRALSFFHERRRWRGSSINFGSSGLLRDDGCFTQVMGLGNARAEPIALSDIIDRAEQDYRECIGARRGEVIRRLYVDPHTNEPNVLVSVGSTWDALERREQRPAAPYRFPRNPIRCGAAAGWVFPGRSSYESMLIQLQHLEIYSTRIFWRAEAKWEHPTFPQPGDISVAFQISVTHGHKPEYFSLEEILERGMEIIQMCVEHGLDGGSVRVGPNGAATLVFGAYNYALGLFRAGNNRQVGATYNGSTGSPGSPGSTGSTDLF